MTDTMLNTFKETVKTVSITGKVHGFRLCIDEKDNISVSKVGLFVPLFGHSPYTTCPSGTKKILEAVITPI